MVTPRKSLNGAFTLLHYVSKAFFVFVIGGSTPRHRPSVECRTGPSPLDELVKATSVLDLPGSNVTFLFFYASSTPCTLGY